MSTDLTAYRRFFAEEIQMVSNIRTPALVEALANVPREQFLPPGPWVVRGAADMMAPLRTTPGDDPRFIYHNIAVGIDPARMLFNGEPGMLASVIDALGLAPGARVLHIGTGAGYYTALIAETVGASGRVVGIEVDADLAATAAGNLASMPWVEVQHGDARQGVHGPFDAILVNAGITHPEPQWLDQFAPGGRIMMPLTAAMGLPPGMPHPAGSAMASISKGLMVLVTATGRADRYTVRVVTFVAIYSAMGLRDEDTNRELGRAMSKTPFPPLKHLRFDAHDADESCWCHTTKGCWSTA